MSYEQSGPFFPNQTNAKRRNLLGDGTLNYLSLDSRARPAGHQNPLQLRLDLEANTAREIFYDIGIFLPI